MTTSYGSQLRNHLFEKWSNINLNQRWMLVTEGTIDGYFPIADLGAIDLLAKSRDGEEWLVIAINGNNDSDSVIGKLLSHMGWVKKNLAEKGHTVQGVRRQRLWDR